MKFTLSLPGRVRTETYLRCIQLTLLKVQETNNNSIVLLTDKKLAGFCEGAWK